MISTAGCAIPVSSVASLQQREAAPMKDKEIEKKLKARGLSQKQIDAALMVNRGALDDLVKGASYHLELLGRAYEGAAS